MRYSGGPVTTRRISKTEHPLLYCRPDPEIRFDETSTAFYSSKLERSVEVHLRLWERDEDKIDIQLPGDLFERSVQRHWDGFAYVALSDEDCLVFQVLHAFRHLLRNWCRLSIFLEISYFLNQRFSDSAFWARFADRIENMRWAPEATAIVFGLSEHLFGASIPPQIQPSLTTPLYPALKLWNERYGRKSALTNFRNDKSSLFLYREFVDDASAWSGIWHTQAVSSPSTAQTSSDRVPAWILIFRQIVDGRRACISPTEVSLLVRYLVRL